MVSAGFLRIDSSNQLRVVLEHLLPMESALKLFGKGFRSSLPVSQ